MTPQERREKAEQLKREVAEAADLLAEAVADAGQAITGAFEGLRKRERQPFGEWLDSQVDASDEAIQAMHDTLGTPWRERPLNRKQAATIREHGKHIGAAPESNADLYMYKSRVYLTEHTMLHGQSLDAMTRPMPETHPHHFYPPLT